MVLRCLLVSLVASLGFELPSGQDVTSWTMSSRSWVSARAVDLSALGAEASGWLGLNDPTVQRMAELAATKAESTSEPETTLPSLTAEFAFELINEDMALSFADDQARLLAATVAEAPPIGEAESPASGELAGETIASTEPVPNPELDPLARIFAGPVTDSIDEAPGTTPDVVLVPTDRLNSAVRLTREAVHAWASLAQAMGSEVVLSR